MMLVSGPGGQLQNLMVVGHVPPRQSTDGATLIGTPQVIQHQNMVISAAPGQQTQHIWSGNIIETLQVNCHHATEDLFLVIYAYAYIHTYADT